MPIRLDLTSDTAAAMEGSDIEGGAFDADQVYFQFICQTGPNEEHDPDKPPDNRVRPEHAALHGTVWRLDDPAAPIPPVDWGCRCAIRYVSKPGSAASTVLPEAPHAPEVSPARSSQAWLNEHVKRWPDVADAMRDAPTGSELSAGYAKAREMGIRDARAIVRMIEQIRKNRETPDGRSNR